MKKVFVLLLVLACSIAFAEKVYFVEPYNAITGLDSANTTVLMHFENNFDDLGGTTWTEGGTAWSFTTDAAKFNQYGIEDNTTIYSDLGFITAGTSTPFIFDTGDFTIEYWQRVSSITQVVTESFPGFLVNIQKDASNYWAFYTAINTSFGDDTNYTLSGSVDLYVGGGLSDSISATSTVALTVGDWAHVCFQRKSGVGYIFINGALVAQSAGAAATYNFSATNVVDVTAVRQLSGAKNFIGALNYDEFRVVDGVAEYADSFTPPPQPFGPPVYQKIITAPDGKLIFEN